MPFTTPPTVDPLVGTPPNRGQTEEDFNTNQQNFVDYQVGFVPDINAATTWINGATEYVDTALDGVDVGAADAAASASAAEIAETNAEAAAAAAQQAAGLTPDPDFGMVISTQAVANLKTATFTAAVGETYRLDTSGGSFNFNPPPGMTQGQVFHIIDYAGTFNLYPPRLLQAGYKIMFQAKDLLLTQRWQRRTFEYAGTTKGLEF